MCGDSQGAVLCRLEPRLQPLMVLQGPGESRWAHKKEHGGIREAWRREGKQDSQEWQGGIWAGRAPVAELCQRPGRGRLH